MAATVPDDIPDTLAAGDTWRWDVAFSDYPAGDGWALAYYVRGASSLDITAAASMVAADGDGWSITVPAASTATLTAGTYEFLARVSLSGAVYTVDSGKLVVTPNVATAAAGALQSHAERMLADIEAELEARMPGDGSAHESYQIGTGGGGSRALSKVPLPELYAMRNKYSAEVARQKAGGALPPFAVHFAPAGRRSAAGWT